MKVPPPKYDTTKGNSRVYVKFNDNEFLPLYVIYYDAPNRTKSNYFKPKNYRRKK